MSGSGIHVARTSHSHLFPGAVVWVDGLDDPAAQVCEPQPVGLVIRFADGVEADAELLVPSGGPAGDALLAVEGYLTRAGTAVPARAWLIRERGLEGASVALRLGSKIPPD